MVFWRGRRSEFSSKQGMRGGSAHLQSTFFISLFSMLGKLAKADGRVGEAEIAAVTKLIDEELQLPPQRKKVAIDIFNAAKDSPVAFESFASDFYDLFRGQPEVLQMMLEILERVARADGAITRDEERLLFSVRRVFRMTRNEGGYYEQFHNQDRTQEQKTTYEESREESPPPQEGVYSVLGLRADASVSEIKKAYRKIVLECHPDRLISKGVPEEFRARAEERFKEVQRAYDIISKERGF